MYIILQGQIRWYSVKMKKKLSKIFISLLTLTIPIVLLSNDLYKPFPIIKNIKPTLQSTSFLATPVAADYEFKSNN